MVTQRFKSLVIVLLLLLALPIMHTTSSVSADVDAMAGTVTVKGTLNIPTQIQLFAYDTNKYGIYLVDNGTVSLVSSVNVENINLDSVDAQLSPNGQKVSLLVRYGVDGTTELRVTNLDGTNPTALFDRASNVDVLQHEWSHDGSKIAYTIVDYTNTNVNNEPTAQVWMVNQDGTEKTQIATEGARELLGWSSDDNSVYFSHAMVISDTVYNFSDDLSNPGFETFTRLETGGVSGVEIANPNNAFTLFENSADALTQGGEQFYTDFFLLEDSNGNQKIGATGVTGGVQGFTTVPSSDVTVALTNLPTNPIANSLSFTPIMSNTESIDEIAISPDGARLAYILDLRGGVWVADTTGNNHYEVVSSGLSKNLSWGNDGQTLSASAEEMEGLTIVNLQGEQIAEFEVVPTNAYIQEDSAYQIIKQFSVPYIHQLWDTPDWFNGRCACGPTSTAMALAFYDKLPRRSITISVPTPHTNDYGYYVAESFDLGNGKNFTASSGTPANSYQCPAGRGLYGAMVRPIDATHAHLLQSAVEKFGISTQFFDSNGISFTRIQSALNAGHLVVLSNQLTSAGHLILVTGYTDDGKLVVNDPYGNKQAGNYGRSANGRDVVYPWSYVGAKWMVIINGTPPVSQSGSSDRDNITLNYNQPDNNRLEQNGDTDTYYFQGAVGDQIEITMDKVGGDLDTYLKLYRPNNSLLNENDDVGTGNYNSKIVVTLPESGRFKIVASAYQNETRGDYQIQVRKTGTSSNNGNNGERDNITLTYNTSDNNTLETNSDIDTYYFQGVTGDIVEITMEKRGGDLDPYLILNNPSGAYITHNDDTVETNSRIRYTLQESGRYQIKSRSYEFSSRGDYTVKVQKSGSSSGNNSGNWIQFGQTINDAISSNTEQDTFYFNGTSGDRVTIRMNKTDSGLDPYVELYNGNVKVAENDDGGGDTNSLLVYSLPSSGAYKIVARSYNGSSNGRYSLNLDRTQSGSGSSGSGGNLARGKPVSVSSTEVSQFPGQYAVDGNRNTRWSSQFVDPSWIYVDLGQNTSFDQVILHWETAYAREYVIYVQGASDCGSCWSQVYHTASGDGGSDNITFSARTARYVLIHGVSRATRYGYSLYEIEVYNRSSAYDPFVYPESESKEADTIISLPSAFVIEGKEITLPENSLQENTPLIISDTMILTSTISVGESTPEALLYNVDDTTFVVPNVPITVTGYGTDENGSGIIGYRWYLDTGSVITDVVPDNVTILGNTADLSLDSLKLPDGDHTLMFQVMDDEGNWSEAISRTVSVRNDASVPLSITTTNTLLAETEGSLVKICLLIAVILCVFTAFVTKRKKLTDN